MHDQRERKFWQRVRKHLTPKVFVRRIENGVAGGDPDVFLMKYGKVIWLELKWAEQPVKRTSKLLGKDALRLDQVNWHLEYAHKGGISFVLIGTHGTDYLVPGKMAATINEMSVDEMESYAAHCCTSIGSLLEKVLWP